MKVQKLSTIMIAKTIKTQHVTNLFILYVIYFLIMQAAHFDEINYLSDSFYTLFYLLIIGAFLSTICLFKKNLLTYFFLLLSWILNFWINPFAIGLATPVISFFIILFMLQVLLKEKPKVFTLAVNALLIYSLARYFYFGFSKLTSEQWINGTVFEKISSTILVRPAWSKIDIPRLVSIPASWFVILVEVLSPIALLPKLRSKYLILLLVLHIQIATYLRLLELSIPFILGLLWFYLYEIERKCKLEDQELTPAKGR